MRDEEIDKMSRASFRNSFAANEAKHWKGMEELLEEGAAKSAAGYWWGLGIVVLAIATSFGWLTINSSLENTIAWQIAQVETESLNSNSASQNPATESKKNTLPNSQEYTKIQEVKPEVENVKPTPTEEIATETKIESEAKTFSPSNQLNKSSAESNGVTSALPINSEKSKGSKKEKVELDSESGGLTIDQGIPTNDHIAKQEYPESNKTFIDESGPVTGEVVEGQSSTMAISESNEETNKELLEPIQSSSIENQEYTAEEAEKPADVPIGGETEFGENLSSKAKFRFFIQPTVSYLNSEKGQDHYSETSSSNSHVGPSKIQDWSGGLDLGIQFKRFYFKTGLHYQELNQSFSIRTQQTEISDEYQYKDRLVGQEVVQSGVRYEVYKVPLGSGFSYRGQSFAVYDTNDVYVTDTIINKTEVYVESQQSVSYKLQYFQIPVIVGYEYILGSKWLIDVSAGMNFGILINQSGSTFNSSSEEIVSIFGSSASKTTVSYSAGIGVGYFLLPDLSIRLSPTYRHMSKGPFNYAKVQRNFYGVDLGFRYKF